jgi:adenine deaminase
LGIEDRGVLSRGYRADVVLLSDRSVKYVLLNGNLTLEDGELTNSLDGVTLFRL